MTCVLHYYLVCIRFVVLCETYLRRKDELTKGERKEILEYARGRYVCVCIRNKHTLKKYTVQNYRKLSKNITLCTIYLQWQLAIQLNDISDL